MGTLGCSAKKKPASSDVIRSMQHLEHVADRLGYGELAARGAHATRCRPGTCRLRPSPRLTALGLPVSHEATRADRRRERWAVEAPPNGRCGRSRLSAGMAMGRLLS